MHLSRVGIYSAAFLSPTRANLTVRVVRNKPDPLSPPQNSLMGIPWAPRGEGPSQGCSGTRPSLISAWLVWLPHTTALNSAWANLSQGEGNQIFLSSTSSVLHKDTLQGAAARWVCPAFPGEAPPSPSHPRRKVAEHWGKHHTACALASPGVQGQGLCLITVCPSVAMEENVKEREDLGKWPQRNSVIPGAAQVLLQAPLERNDQAAEGISVVWAIPLWRVQLSCMCLHCRICSGFLFYISKRPVPFVNRGAEAQEELVCLWEHQPNKWIYI